MKKYLFIVLSLLLLSITGFAGNMKQILVTFYDGTVNAPAEEFLSFTGKWYIDKDGKNLVYAVDGRNRARGVLSEEIVRKAKELYGAGYDDFLDSMKEYKNFPLSIFKGWENFTDGTISVKFKGISGRIDQGAGIAFNIKQNGDYLVVRANPLENNLVLFKLEKGRRSSVKWVRNVETPSLMWHTLKVAINGTNIKCYVNNKLYLNYNHQSKISGKIGLWSKADSYMFFDDFRVTNIIEKCNSIY